MLTTRMLRKYNILQEEKGARTRRDGDKLDTFGSKKIGQGWFAMSAADEWWELSTRVINANEWFEGRFNIFIDGQKTSS